MLSLNEIITYSPLVLIILGGVIGLLMLTIFWNLNHDAGSIPFAFVSIVLGIFVIATIVNSSIEYKTITPCAIADGLVADMSDTIYAASPDIMIKMHLNQTTNVTIFNQFLAPRGLITDTSGSACPPHATGC